MRKLAGYFAAFLLLAFCIVGCEPKNNTLVVGCDKNFVPFVFSQDGKYVGFDIDLWEAIAQELGLEYQLQPMDFNQLIPALKDKKIGVAIAGMTITSKREEDVDFSHPYFDAGLLLMVRADTKDINSISDLNGKIVATKQGTTSADFVKSLKLVDHRAGNTPTYQSDEMKLFPEIESAYKALADGGVDAVIFDSPSVLYHLKSEGKGSLKTTGPLYKRQSYGIAFQPGSDLKEKVSVTLLKFMEDGTYNKIYKKWFGYLKEMVQE
jgi:glutamine transport system substrate-binding protein